MKAAGVYIKRVNVRPPLVELYLTDNTIQRYPLQKIHDYVNTKTPADIALKVFERMIDKDHWFSKTGREPTLRILAEEYKRAMQTDLGCPVTILTGMFLSDGASAPHAGWALLDGTHRLVKCLVKGGDTVRAVELTTAELQQHVAEVDR